MARTRQTRKDSVSAKVKAEQDKKMEAPVPVGVTFDDARVEAVYRQYFGARARDQWREIDLVLIADAAALEVKIRELTVELEDQGEVIETARGSKIANPLVQVIGDYRRQRLAVIRTLSLGVSGNKGANLNNSGTAAIETKPAGTKTKPVRLLTR